MLLVALLSTLAVQGPSARVEVTPAETELEVGQSRRFAARVLDSAGAPVSGATLAWFTASDGGTVDSTGLVTAGHAGYLRVAAVAYLPGGRGQVVGFALVRVVPEPPARVDIAPAVTRIVAGTRVTLVGTAYSRANDPRADPVTFASSNPRVASVTGDGRLRAVVPGRATITARVGPATATRRIEVLANTVARLELSPTAATVRTGDVLRLALDARDARGRALRDVAADWTLGAGAGVAAVDPTGAFVAELPGVYTVSARVGARTADAVIRVVERRVTRPIEVRAHLATSLRTTEVWVHPSGRCAYLGTVGDRVYAVDVTNVAAPRLVDSMMTDARLVNDVMTTEDGRYGVFSREGASTRRNGIVVFEAGDPCHPRPIAEYTETVSGGVHSAYIYRGHVYLTDDATGSLRVISLADHLHPREVARWQTPTEAGRYLHDVDVRDGLAYLSYWSDGLVILDVGNGLKGGSPTNPQLVSQFKYDLDATYARVEQLFGRGFVRGTHTAWRAGRYVFVGDEVYPAQPYRGLQGGNSLTFGRLHVVDVSDLARPQEVAWYEPTDGGVHNIWVAGDTLYLGNYQGGARVLDVSGELKGDLLRQGREIGWIPTADSTGVIPRVPYAWGAVVRDGNVFVPDMNSGLWILRLAPRESQVP